MSHLVGETPDQRVARLAAARHGVFTRDEALRSGATPRVIRWRVSSGRWERVHPGVYRLAGAPAPWRQDLAAACVSAGARAAASHRSGGRLWRLPRSEDDCLEITVPAGIRVRRRCVIVHEAGDLLPVDVTVVDAIPVTTPTRTLIDLAAILKPEAVEEALDDALRRRLTSISRLRWRLDALGRSGKRGVSVIRELVDARSGDGSVPQSVLETRFMRLVRRNGLADPVRQYRVRDGGRSIAVVDFAYPGIRLAVEIDGYRWHSGRSRWESDLARRNALTAAGWRVIHITANDIERREIEVVAQIACELSGL